MRQLSCKSAGAIVSCFITSGRPVRAGRVHHVREPVADERGRSKPYLMDFGIAHQVSATGITATGQILGTPQYMSPEQARGAAGEFPLELSWQTPGGLPSDFVSETGLRSPPPLSLLAMTSRSRSPVWPNANGQLCCATLARDARLGATKTGPQDFLAMKSALMLVPMGAEHGPLKCVRSHETRGR